MKISVILSSIFLFLVSIVHLLRFIFQLKVTVENYELPIWMSLPAFAFTLFLSFFLIFEERKRISK